MNDVPLEGDITVPGLKTQYEDQEISTLDEPVKETIVSKCIIFIHNKSFIYCHLLLCQFFAF